MTLVTQIGGFIFLIYEFIHPSFTKKIKSKGSRVFAKILFFGLLYAFFSILLVPPIAKYFGRVPLPFLLERNEYLKPAAMFYPLANRHYVKEELRDVIYEVAEDFCSSNKLDNLTYLDANFPFIEGYPLHPHLSHDDGEKLDISFVFKKNGKHLTKSPSWLGYGYVEGPKKGEEDKPSECGENNRNYNMLTKFVRQDADVEFDKNLNKALLRKLSAQKLVKKIFIEPHLKSRMRLNSDSKIKFQGCHSVRHDDHIHIQL